MSVQSTTGLARQEVGQLAPVRGGWVIIILAWVLLVMGDWFFRVCVCVCVCVWQRLGGGVVRGVVLPPALGYTDLHPHTHTHTHTHTHWY